MKFIKNKKELNAQIEEGILDALTGKDNTILDVLEMAAISEISGYISGKYNTTEMFSQKGDSRDVYLITMTIDIMLFRLYSRTSSNNIPEIRVSNYAKTIDYLEKVSKGLVVPTFPLKDSSFDSNVSEMICGSDRKINNGEI